MTTDIFFDIISSLIVLTILEVILSIDNLVFIAIVSQKLSASKRQKARQIGLTFAWMMRLLILSCAIWLTKLTTPFLTLFGWPISGRNLFLLIGGLFLLAKSTQEIHAEIDLPRSKNSQSTTSTRFGWVIVQVAALDVIFSLDSILTAIGLTQRFWLMAIAITISIIAMLAASEPLSRLIMRYPTLKMLALSFLILIGMVLIADSFEFHIPRGYIYFSMAFSLFIELLNILRRNRHSLASTKSRK